MATFRVGMRVKNARPRYPKNLGNEGIITYLEHHFKGTVCSDGALPYDTDCFVRWDYSGLEHPQAFWQLEPLQPEGWQKVSWDSCLWAPDRVSETV